jgi:hypothetical protein
MSDAFDDLDALTLEAIGDQITYARGGVPATINGWIDHSPDVIDFGVTSGVTMEAALQVRKLDVPEPNRSTDRITLPRTGKIYKIATVPLHSRCGRYWNIALVAVAG